MILKNQLILMLGSNVGNRNNYLELATKFLIEELGELTIESSIYETAPWGLEDQSVFLNQVVVVNTNKSARESLEIALSIEKKMGRDRSKSRKGGKREIDIDILFFNDDIVNDEQLTIPHPRIEQRNFVLIPLKEVLPDCVHPQSGLSISDLVAQTTDRLIVKKLKN